MELTGYGAITSVVAAHAGDVVAEDYLVGDADTLRDTRSCTKTVLGMLLGQAIDRGLVAGVDARVLELLGGRQPAAHAGPAKQALTVKELLTMSSCLDCNDWDDSSPGNEELMYPQRDWLQFALDLPVRSGRGFNYCTAGVVTLGIALEHAVGEQLSAFARRALFEPLGIDRAEWQETPDGHTSTAGGLRLTSRALLALGELYLGGGRSIVPAAWVRESLQAYARIDERDGVRLSVVVEVVRRCAVVLHDRDGRQPRARLSRARVGRRDHLRELRPPRRARPQRPALGRAGSATLAVSAWPRYFGVTVGREAVGVGPAAGKSRPPPSGATSPGRLRAEAAVSAATTNSLTSVLIQRRSADVRIVHYHSH